MGMFSKKEDPKKKAAPPSKGKNGTKPGSSSTVSSNDSSMKSKAKPVRSKSSGKLAPKPSLESLMKAQKQTQKAADKGHKWDNPLNEAGHTSLCSFGGDRDKVRKPPSRSKSGEGLRRGGPPSRTKSENLQAMASRANREMLSKSTHHGGGSSNSGRRGSLEGRGRSPGRNAGKSGGDPGGKARGKSPGRLGGRSPVRESRGERGERGKSPGRNRGRSVGRNKSSESLASFAEEPASPKVSKLGDMRKTQELESLRKEKNTLSREKFAAEMELEETKEKNASLERKLRDLERQLERSKASSTATPSVNRGDQEKIKDLEQENMDLKMKLKKERREHEQITFQKDREVRELNETIDNMMEAENRKMGGSSNKPTGLAQAETLQSQAKVRELERQVQDLKNQVNEKDLALKAFKDNKVNSAMKPSSGGGSGEIEKLREENASLQDKVKFKDETIDHLMDQLKRLKTSRTGDSAGGTTGGVNANAEGAGIAAAASNIWNSISPGTLRRNNQNMNRSTRKGLTTPDI